MHSIIELYIIKSKSKNVIIETIDDFTSFCLKEPSIDFQSIVKADSSINITEASKSDFIKSCLLSIYAHDISGVMDSKLRAPYIKTLKEIIDNYGLDYNQILNLSKYAEKFVAHYNGATRKSTDQ